jgi:hypothetical protein
MARIGANDVEPQGSATAVRKYCIKFSKSACSFSGESGKFSDAVSTCTFIFDFI